MEQIELDIEPIPYFRTGLRVDGKETEVFDVPAMTYEEAAKRVKDEIPGANPILVRVK